MLSVCVFLEGLSHTYSEIAAVWYLVDVADTEAEVYHEF